MTTQPSICLYLSRTAELLTETGGADDLQDILNFWLHHCDPTQESTLDEPSAMHVLGIGLCCAMSHAPPIPTLLHFSEATAFGAWHDVLVVHPTAISEMHWDELTDTLASLQMEFHNLFSMEEKGFVPCIDIESVLLAIMRRMGHWMSVRTQLRNESEALRSLYDADNEQHSRLRCGVLTDAMDALHAMWSSMCLLLRAKPLQHDANQSACLQAVPLFNHHREASLDSFYEISMVSDLAPGAILQYKNKFRVLFHSISQVIYFHYPAYDRQIQRPMSELNCYKAPAVNLLPLLLQLDPDMSVQYEHTSRANSTESTGKSQWHWKITAGYVLLVNAAGDAYFSVDLRHLYLHAHQTGELMSCDMSA